MSEIARALALERRLASHESWRRARLEAAQRRMLSELIEHAVARSRFYSWLYRGVREPAARRLEELPTVTRSELMARFDEWVIDRRVRLADLEDHLAGLHGDERHLGAYRVLSTAGSSGRRGILVFDRREWNTAMALSLRWASMIGVGPRLPRVRAASIGAASPRHMTYRLAVSLDFGLHRVRRLDATAPLPKLVSALNAFQPHWLHAYSSLAALLAREQVEGRLRIAPRTVSTSSELRTPEMERAMVEAWGTRPFDCYGITEVGIFGSDCPEHRGIHAFEDALIFEVVDEHRRPVPAGEQGRMLLLTNLYNRTQPLIRYEVTDMITAVAEQCPCGRPFRLVGKVAGRCDDILELPDGRGGHVEVHPIALRAALGAVPEVREYQVLQLAEAIDVRVVASPEVAGEALATRVRNALREGLARSGAEPPQLRIEFADRIDRDPAEMGKLKLVRSKPGRPAS